jgi:hypothetical protein
LFGGAALLVITGSVGLTSFGYRKISTKIWSMSFPSIVTIFKRSTSLILGLTLSTSRVTMMWAAVKRIDPLVSVDWQRDTQR